MNNKKTIAFDAAWKLRWDILVSLCVLVSVVVIPLLLVFHIQSRAFFYYLDLFINIIFLLDIVLAFNTSFMENFQVVVDPVKIRKKYLKGFFIPDLLAALPYGIAAGTGIPVIARAGRILMLLRMIKIPVLFRTFKRVRRNKIGTNAVRSW